MFGELKSKIETYLVESYKKNKLKDSLFVFEELVLNNKNVSRIFFLYDELSDKKGLSESIASEFINESIIAYENSFNKIKPNNLKEIKAWVGHVKCENNYKEIDNFFSSNILTLESKIKSKKVIIETLMSKKQEVKESIKVPLKSMVNVANKTIQNYISSLNENEQKELKTLLSIPKSVLEENYQNEKKVALEKLSTKKSTESDGDTLKTIDQVIEKLQKESFSEINLFKLKSLNEGL